jgi:hypothetical protein
VRHILTFCAHAQDGCAANYTGRVVVRGNSLGFLVTGDLEFSGGQLLDLSNNMADFVQQESIKVCLYSEGIVHFSLLQ